MLPEPFHVCRIIYALTRTDFSGMNSAQIKMVRVERLELSRTKAPEPKSGVSAQFHHTRIVILFGHHSLEGLTLAMYTFIVRCTFITAEFTRKAQQSQGFTDNPAFLRDAIPPNICLLGSWPLTEGSRDF